MKISELIAVLEADMARLGDREMLEGVVSGRHTAFRVQDLLNGDHLGFPGKAIMFLQPIVVPIRTPCRPWHGAVFDRMLSEETS